jgi:hypothetical protein
MGKWNRKYDENVKIVMALINVYEESEGILSLFMV